MAEISEIQIYGTLRNHTPSGIIAYADQIYDTIHFTESGSHFQSDINSSILYKLDKLDSRLQYTIENVAIDIANAVKQVKADIIDGAEPAYDTLKELSEYFKNHDEDAAGQFKYFTEQINELTNTVNSHTTTLETYTPYVDDLRKDVSTLKNTVEQHDTSIQSNTNSIVQVATGLASVKKDISTAQNDISTVQNDISVLNEQINDLENSINQTYSELYDKNSTLYDIVVNNVSTLNTAISKKANLGWYEN